METRKPIKRSKELSPLSRDHHDGLLLCWKINNGLNNNISVDRIGAYALHFFDDKLNAHFLEEELYLFPLLGPGNINVHEAEVHHKMLREMIDSFRNVDQIIPLSLKYFAEILEMHIRYEERVLFPIIEKETSEQSLRLTGDILKNNVKNNIEWHDQFWL